MKTIRPGHTVALLRDIYRIPSVPREEKQFLYGTCGLYRLHLEYGWPTCKPPWYDSLYEHVLYGAKGETGKALSVFRADGTWHVKVLMDGKVKTFRKSSLERI